ncbi:MFS transporter [Deferribacter autotrophicus]|uniref:MFS transporter n=1 Tax=Deferribacter autotrophicus TaxID=500465 RepID=A0A5A8F3C4_9BACT|nr:MFS transporter [Deferribacter autotrophicus]KAA0256984.1 MFS transporter [Deferribacter autotrophicus]
MNKRYIFIVSFVTIMTFSALYAPQPLLPIFSNEFSVTEDKSSLLITITLIPLAIAPLFYGYILEKFSAKKLLLVATGLLAFSELIIYFASDFSLILLARLFQGLFIPAILTALMTYISLISSLDSVQRIMSYYIASTIMGGFFGRFIAGLISSIFGWRYVFLFLSMSLIFSSVLIFKLKKDEKVKVNKINLSVFKDVLSKKVFLYYYFSIFCVFFVFAALLNALPFRMKEISTNIGEFKTGVMYSGYMLGIVASLNSTKIVKIFKGSVRNAALAGATLYLVSLLILSIESSLIFFIGMFFFCGGMFTIHSLVSGFLNKLADKHKGVVNGLYVSFYYLGGSIGSFLPILIYRHYGWYVFLITLGCLILLAKFFIKRC